jgi:protein gp37
MNRTKIEWTDFTANPVRFRTADGRVVWACEKLSAGCANCYAESLSHRYGGVRRAGEWNAATMAGLTPFLDEQELRAMLTYKPASGQRCFVGDMTDIFGEWVPDALLDELFAVMALRKDVTFQILTKRADRMREYCSRLPNKGCNYFVAINGYGSTAVLWGHMDLQPWPLPNVWLGVSAENQKYADERIPLLLQTPAAVRFVSAEPLIGPVNLDRVWRPEYEVFVQALSGNHISKPGQYVAAATWPRDIHYDTRLDWVIVGGESGPKSRPCDVQWIRSIVQQCQAANVPVFCKQLGAHPVDTNPSMGGMLGKTAFPLDPLNDRKGGDMEAWPGALNDLRVRQFPAANQPEAGQ